MDRAETGNDGLGDAARAFLERRLEDSEARLSRAPLGSVARAEAAEEAREIRAILESDRRALAAAIATLTQDRVVAHDRPTSVEPEACPTCRTLRVGGFRFCRSCGHDYEAGLVTGRSTIRAREIR